MGRLTYEARGELGRIWRLPTSTRVVAVKELFAPPTEAEAAADVAFQVLARASGVVAPEPLRRPTSEVLTRLPSGPWIRAYEWLDLAPVSERPAAALGHLLATLHRIAEPTGEPVFPWFGQPVGAAAWRALAARCDVELAPFTRSLAAMISQLVDLESMLPTPRDVNARRCHLDLDVSNLALDPSGRLVVLDWENSGPATPTQELAMVLADEPPEGVPAVMHAYREADGPGAISEPGNFAMAVANQGHLVEFYARRWLTSSDAEDRERSVWRLQTIADSMLTRSRIDDLVAALRQR